MPRYLIALVASLPCLAGCYKYTRVQAGEVPAGVSVRARVSAAAGERVAPLLGSTPRVLTGRLISEARDTVVLEVPAVTQAEIGSSIQTLHQRVSIPKGEIIEWEIRTLNRPRTFALVGGAALLVGAVLINALSGEPGDEGLPGNGGVDSRVLLRLSR